jgi:hypothetical protein
MGEKMQYDFELKPGQTQYALLEDGEFLCEVNEVEFHCCCIKGDWPGVAVSMYQPAYFTGESW